MRNPGNLFGRANTGRRTRSRPGKGYPADYTMDPRPEFRDMLIAELEKEKLYPGGPDPARLEYFKRVIRQWQWEHDRMITEYSTALRGLNNPDYAPKFQAFHRDASALRLIRAPNQVGKTFSCAEEVYLYALGLEWWKKLPPKWLDTSQSKTILIVTGSEKNRVGVMEALWKLCPVDAIDWNTTFYNDKTKWGEKNPSMHFKGRDVHVLFRASSQAAASLNSVTADLIWIDEPPTQNTIDEVRRAGFARGQQIIMSFTPVGDQGEDFTWLKHYVEGDPEHGVLPNGDWSQHVIGIPDCPWISRDQIEERRRGYRKEQFAQRFLGEWQSEAVNKAFTGFIEGGAGTVVIRKIIAKGLANPDSLLELDFSEWSFGVGIDYGEQIHHQVAIFVAYRRTNPKRVIIFDEVINDRKTTPREDAAAIKVKLAKYGLTPRQVGTWRGDINSGGKVSKGEALNKLLGRELGVVILPPRKYAGSVETEERRVNQAFASALRVTENCSTLLQSFRYYQGDGSESDKKYKHSLDAARYILQKVFDILGIDSVQLLTDKNVRRAQLTLDLRSLGGW